MILRRGLRQGDHLSPYLFLIYAEGFSSLLHQAEANNSIQGIKVCIEALSITHLLFADDSLIPMKINENNAKCLQQILQIYEACSSQKINKEKSAIMSRLNTRPDVRERVKQVLQLISETQNEKYLGYLLMLVIQNRNPLSILRIRFGLGYRDGRKNCCLWQEKKF
jgi:hypothetical protein